MGRGLISGALVLLVGAMLCVLAPAVATADDSAAPADAPVTSSCDGPCGVPKCDYPDVNVRPGYTFKLHVQCHDVTDAVVLDQPVGGTVRNISFDSRGIDFDYEADEDAPRIDEIIFRLTGPEGSADRRIGVEAIPTDENQAPICEGDTVRQRSSGSGPVTVFMHPWCYDPEGDPFVMAGGPPGTHPDAPMMVAAGDSNSNWTYVTKTSDGTETAPVWATDVLGARSDDAPLKVTVGPGVDELPDCHTNPWWTPHDVMPVYSRPGVPRRFPLICEDADADDFSVTLTTPPKLGLLSLDVQAPSTGWWGLERWIDATYAPLLPTASEDRFGITVVGGRGNSPEAKIAMVPRLPPADSGGGCGWGGTGVTTAVPDFIRLNCDDEDGDPLLVTIDQLPLHGVAGVPVVTQGKYGYDDIAIPYVSAPGFEGYDCVVISIGDGIGDPMTLTMDIYVRPGTPTIEIPIPPLPIPLPPIGEGRDSVKHAAQSALGTKHVERVKTGGGATAWAREEISRKDLVKFGHAPAIVVVCTSRCDVRSGSTLGHKGAAPRRAKLVRTARTSTPGEVQLVSLAVAGDQRLALRRGRKLEGKFRLKIRPEGERPSSVKRSIPVG